MAGTTIMADRVSDHMAARESTQPNPELVQPEDYSDFTFFSGLKTPLFLIHDGGGTVYSYHCLGRLHRFVYGIRNPHFYSGESFPGGMAQMAKLYAQMIRDQCARGDFPASRNPDDSVDILLGGWSLGGLLSLAVAKLLENDLGVRVVGIIMVDSVCPTRGKARTWVKSSWHPDEPKNRNEVLSRRCMNQARKMVAEWSLPSWAGGLDSKPPTVLVKARHKIPVRTEEPPPPPQTPLQPEAGNTDGYQAAGQATGEANGSNHNGAANGNAPVVHTLDVLRDDMKLGWDEYDADMFVRVIETDGHHFDLFKDQKIAGTTMAFRKALNTLDE